MNYPHLFDHKLWLAPLAGLTDSAFRSIAKQCGADVTVSEMVSADGLVYSPHRTLEYCAFTEDQRPFGIQLFGSDPAMMVRGCEVILAQKPDFIDVNMGCPVKKVVNRNAGSALMKDPRLAGEIIGALYRFLRGTGIPLTVKFRSGWDFQSVNAVEFARIIEDAGADGLTLHPRTRSQQYGGQSDWTLIRRVRESVCIPVVANGDVQSSADAERMRSTTGCDSVMIGRGAVGSPWIFNEIKATVKGIDVDNRAFRLTDRRPALYHQEKWEIIQRHIDLALIRRDPPAALREMRVHLAAYTRGFRGGNHVRAVLQNSLDPGEIRALLKGLYVGEHNQPDLAGEIREET